MSDLIHDTPWLVAVWPGMGSVAALAGTYLVGKLGAKPVAHLPTRNYFDIESVQVDEGLIQPPRPPRVVIYRWENPSGPDLLISIAEAQPSRNGFGLAEELVDLAHDLGARRIATFAAMATPSDPRAPARVFSAGTDVHLLERVDERDEVHRLEEGSISGLNGVLLAAGAARNLPGVCLLGEFPFFASGVPQPKAAAAVLRVFRHLTGVPLDLDELDEQAQVVEQKLTAILRRLEGQGQDTERFLPSPLVREETPAEEPRIEPNSEAVPTVAGLDPAVLAHIEALFAEAEADRARALALKALLDEHGVFREYEDRFLDLFKQGN
ncbi:MAG TPA: hypothetical protein DEA08_08970 [Planctomycetes bacterium]|nr:hypothetical protein [Planctomycetota bacterium]